MFAIFKRMRKKTAALPAVAEAAAPHDIIIRHQLACGPFNMARMRTGRS
jgi:hypothetical protein